MVDIYIKKVNEAYLQIEANLGIRKELHEVFEFFAPGYFYSPKFKNGYWNGKISLYSAKTSQLYAGLVDKVVDFADTKGYSVELDPEFLGPQEFTQEQAQTFIDTLDLHKDGVPVTLRDYQIDAFVEGVRNPRSFLLVSVGGGKTLLWYLLVRWFLTKGLKIILVTPSTSLCSQIRADFVDYSSHNGWDVDEHLHMVFSGQDKASLKPLVITTWQSAITQEDSYFEQFQVLLGEEGDGFKAKSLIHIGTRLVNASYRVGMTGSLDGKKVHEMVLHGLFGTIQRITSTRELMDQGFLTPVKIDALILRHTDEVINNLKRKPYEDELKHILECQSRQRFIVNLAVSLPKTTLVLFQFIEKQGMILFEKIKEQAAPGRKVFYVSGKTPVSERETIRQEVMKDKDSIIVASYGTFSRGINIPNIHDIVLAFVFKAKTKNLQAIGRGVRLDDDKDFVTVYDIVDDLRYKKWNNYAIRHFQERLEIYNEEKFPYRMFNIQLKD